LAVDAAVATAALALALGSAYTQDGARLTPLYVALSLAACGALVLRRRHPVAVLAFTLAVSAVAGLAGDSGGPVFLPFIVALYTAAAEGRLPAAILLAVFATLGVLLRGSAAGSGSARSEENAVLVVGWLVAVLAAGGVAWNRRAYLAEAERRAVEAERGREVDGRRRETEERMRIARELHDVLSHNIAVINVRSGAALFHLTDGERDVAGLRVELVEALTVIRCAGLDAGRELRATLGVLRQAAEEPGIAPAPGLARLPDLVDTVGRAGLQVRATVQAANRRVPAEVDLAAFRIVQEALTNVARHADTKVATVRVFVDSDDLHIRIENEGTPEATPPTSPVAGGAAGDARGYGIQGMIERATALGGDLRAGPRGDGGFEVSARLPIREHA
jgi:signal transduction histidine kinase